jgi:hypothetical protein
MIEEFKAIVECIKDQVELKDNALKNVKGIHWLDITSSTTLIYLVGKLNVCLDLIFVNKKENELYIEEFINLIFAKDVVTAPALLLSTEKGTIRIKLNYNSSF